MGANSFSVGCSPEVAQYRRMAEDRIAKVCFHKRSRTEMGKRRPMLHEKIWTAIALASDSQVKEFFGDGD